jgi:hypothetical protein
MKNSFTKKVWISLGVIILSIIIASVALYYFSNDLAAQASKVITDRQAVSAQSDQLGSLAQLESDAPKAAGYVIAMNQLMPDQYGLVGFGPWLNQVAKKYAVTVSYAFQGQPALSNGATPGSIDFSLTAQGSSGSVVSFLNNIESQSPGFILTFSSFDYTNDSSAGPAAETVKAQGTLFTR